MSEYNDTVNSKLEQLSKEILTKVEELCKKAKSVSQGDIVEVEFDIAEDEGKNSQAGFNFLDGFYAKSKSGDMLSVLDVENNESILYSNEVFKLLEEAEYILASFGHLLPTGNHKF